MAQERLQCAQMAQLCRQGCELIAVAIDVVQHGKLANGSRKRCERVARHVHGKQRIQPRKRRETLEQVVPADQRLQGAQTAE